MSVNEGAMVSVVSLPRVSSPTPLDEPLEAGDRLDQPTFHARYERMPPGFRAELIGGVVHVPSPVRLRHGRPYINVIKWLAAYEQRTPRVELLSDVTAILGDDSEPQPDSLLRLTAGGRTGEDAQGYLVGPPEFVVEVASATESYDLHAKLADYDRHGVAEYLALVVRTREPAWFYRTGGRLVRRLPDADGVGRSAVFPGLWLDAAALFAGDLRRVRAVLKRGMATPDHKAFAASVKSKRSTAAETLPSPRSGRRLQR